MDLSDILNSGKTSQEKKEVRELTSSERKLYAPVIIIQQSLNLDQSWKLPTMFCLLWDCADYYERAPESSQHPK